MKRTDVYRISVPFLPLLILIGTPAVIMMRAGEFTDVDQVITLQQKQEVLYGLRYTDPVRQINIRHMISRDPEIITLGSSRTWPFRKEFFKEQVNFYNASLAVQTTHELNQFLSELPAVSNLRVIVLGLDYWMFNSKYKKHQDPRSKIFSHP